MEQQTPTLRDRGPVGPRVAKAVDRLRIERNLSQQGLADRMVKLGRKFNHSGVAKIENGHRRVDVDDLVALAVALDTNPNALLLSPYTEKRRIRLTEKVTVPAPVAWRWAVGDEALPNWWGEDGTINVTRGQRLEREAKPHEAAHAMGTHEFIRTAPEEASSVKHAVEAAFGAGVDAATIVDYVRQLDAGRALVEGTDRPMKRPRGPERKRRG